MKYFSLLFTLFVVAMANTQIEVEVKIMYVVESFFYTLKHQNEFGMKKVVSPDVIVQPVGLNTHGIMNLRKDNFNDLVNSVIMIPDSISFQEKIFDYKYNQMEAWHRYGRHMNFGIMANFTIVA